MSFKDVQIVRESREAEGDFIGHSQCYLSEFHKENSLRCSLRCLRDLEENRKRELSEEDVRGYDVTINSETDSKGVGFCSLDLCE